MLNNVGDLMELQLIKLMFYCFIGVTAALFIYITVLAVLFIKHIRSDKLLNNIKKAQSFKLYAYFSIYIVPILGR